MNKKERIDRLLVSMGLAPSRERAQSLVMAGQVLVNDTVIDKPGTTVPVESQVRLRGEDHPYVSRGGLKLAHALKEFDVDPTGLVAIDVGASTGGFTDCLLQHGAAKVYAVDVGYGQLAWKLRQDQRVVSLEKTNIRYLDKSSLPDKPLLAVIDASFISLSKVLPSVIELVSPSAMIIALIKPQFEVGKGALGKGGVVRDAGQHQAVIESVCQEAERLGLTVFGVVPSPILGPKGNREFLVRLTKQKGENMQDCLFCRIISGEIPAKIVFEDDRVVVIQDIAPAAPHHFLLLPRKHLASVLDLASEDDLLIGHLHRVAADLARKLGFAENGFRIVINTNADGGQTVFHLHVHLLAGRSLAWPPG